MADLGSALRSPLFRGAITRLAPASGAAYEIIGDNSPFVVRDPEGARDAFGELLTSAIRARGVANTGAPGTPPSAPPPSLTPPTTYIDPIRRQTPMANPNGPMFNPLADPGAVDPFPRFSPSVNPITSDQGGQVLKLGASLCDKLPAGPTRWACEAASAVGTILLGRGESGQDLTATQGNCASGYHKDSTGRCVKNGVEGMIERTLPFGETGVAWEPVAGRYGVGSLPVLVQSARRACPNGMVLGKDGVCYEHLARGQRAWNPGAKPMLTGGDVNALRRAKTLKKKITKLQRAYAPAPKACGPKTRKR